MKRGLFCALVAVVCTFGISLRLKWLGGLYDAPIWRALESDSAPDKGLLALVFVLAPVASAVWMIWPLLERDRNGFITSLVLIVPSVLFLMVFVSISQGLMHGSIRF